jgi:hypothetical protein
MSIAESVVNTVAGAGSIGVNMRGGRLDVLDVVDHRTEVETRVDKAVRGMNLGNDVAGTLGATGTIATQWIPTASAASGALGWVGTGTAVIGLGADLITMGMRSADADHFRKELAKIPQGDEHAVRRAMTEAMYTRGKQLAISSGIGVASDVVGVAGSLVPVVGLPANVLAVSVAVIRIFAEKGIDKRLLEKLKTIVADYEKQNPGLTKDVQAFKDLRKVLENACTKAEEERTQAKENYKKEIANYEQLGRPQSLIPRLEAARFEVQLKEANVKQTQFDLNECIEASFNLEAYNDARGLIKELDEKAKIEKEQRSTIHYVESEMRKEGSNFSTMVSHLETRKKALKKELHKAEKQRKDHEGSGMHDHDIASITKELRHTRLKLVNFRAYPDACKAIEKLDKKRAIMAKELADKEAQKPMTSDHFLTHVSVSADPQPLSTRIHVPTDSHHHLKIKTHLQPSGDHTDPVSMTIHSSPSLVTTPSVSRVSSEPQSVVSPSKSESIPELPMVTTSVLISQPESGKTDSPPPYEVSKPVLPEPTLVKSESLPPSYEMSKPVLPEPTPALVSQPETAKVTSPSISEVSMPESPKSAPVLSSESSTSTPELPRYLSETISSRKKMRQKANLTPDTAKTGSPTPRKLVIA